MTRAICGILICEENVNKKFIFGVKSDFGVENENI